MALQQKNIKNVVDEIWDEFDENENGALTQ